MTSINVAHALLPAVAVELAELGRATASEAERSSRVDVGFVESLRRVGIVTAPTSHGGVNPPLSEVLDFMRVVAEGDGSAGWLAMIYLTSAVGGHWLDVEGRNEVFAKGTETLVAGVLAPKGHATPVRGGFEVSGQWAFGSGSADADWIGLGAAIEDAPGATGVFFIPREEIEIVPTWQVMGLRATASNDQRVSRTWVPKSRVAYFDGPNLTSEPIASFPIFGLLAAGIGAVAIGIAQAALEEFTDLSGAKTPTGSKRRLADRGSVQEAVGRAHVGIESAWYYLAQQSSAVTADKARLRLAATNAVETGRRIVDSLYTLAGGTSLYELSPLQRHFRDIHVATQHMMVAQPTWELTGRVLLGLETDPPNL